MNTKRPALMERTCSFGAGLLYGGIDGRENEPDFSAFPNLYESYTKPIQGDCIMSAIRDVHIGGNNRMSLSAQSTVSRRNFLKIAAGSALSAAVFSMPSLSLAREFTAKARRSVKPVSLHAIPQDAAAAAQASPLIRNSFEAMLSMVGTIKNRQLRSAVLDLLQKPVPTFMQEYSSGAAKRRLYAVLADRHLVNPSNTDEEHLLPPFNGTVQDFLSAPGSGNSRHHMYPGGLVTHTLCNMHITDYIAQTYEEVFCYSVDKDIAIAAQALHDVSKPFVFQWYPDGSFLDEYKIAGQGAHHPIALAEVIYRGFPPEKVVAQACAHGAPTTKQEEAEVASWLKAAAIIAGKDPVAYGLIGKDEETIPAPHRQEGYLVHLGDHDYVLAAPAAKKSIELLKKIAWQEYGMNDRELEGAPFNHFRNYVGAQLSYMYLNMLEAEPNGYDLAVAKVAEVILK